MSRVVRAARGVGRGISTLVSGGPSPSAPAVDTSAQDAAAARQAQQEAAARQAQQEAAAEAARQAAARLQAEKAAAAQRQQDALDRRASETDAAAEKRRRVRSTGGRRRLLNFFEAGQSGLSRLLGRGASLG